MANGNPFLVTPGGDMSQGLGMLGQALQYRRSEDERQQQLQQQQEQQAQVQAGKQALQQAYQSGNPDDIANAMIKYPEMASVLQGAMQFKSDATRQNLVSSARDVLMNPAQTEEILKKRIQMVTEAGGDPKESIAALAEYKQDPEGFMQNAKNIYAMYDPQGFKSYQSAQPQQAMTPYQSAMININQQNADIRRLQVEQKMLEDKAKQKTTDLNQQELQQKIQANKQNQAQVMQERKNALTNAYTNSVDTINLASAIMNSPGLSGATGLSSLFPTAPGSKTAKTESLIDTLNSKTYLDSVQQMKGMGALSDAEGKKLSSAIASLNTNMSEKDFKGSLNTIIQITKRAQTKASNKLQKLGYSVPNVENAYQDNQDDTTPNPDISDASQSNQGARMTAPSAAIDYVRSNPSSLQEFKEKYGYVPTIAPSSAIEFVKNNPQYKSQFKEKYGYLPGGM
jgi:hypothetical protein